MRARFTIACFCAAWLALLLPLAARGADSAWAADTEADVLADENVPVLDDFGVGAASFQPRWTARAGAVILQRANPASQSMITSLSGPELLNARDYQFGTQGGPDLYLLRHGQLADVEFRYFGVNQWTSATRSISDPLGMQFQFADPSQTVINTGVAVNTAYASALNSAELNLRQNVTGRLSLLAGFRFLSLREHIGFDIGLLNGTQVLDATLSANNRLYGFQVGADDILWDNGRGLRVEGVIKAGVFGNDAQNGFALLQGRDSGSAALSRMHTAFVGDLALTGVYQINSHWALRGGYQLLWVSGVALASDQMHVIDPGDRGAILSVDTNGTAFFHGALVSAECSW